MSTSEKAYFKNYAFKKNAKNNADFIALFNVLDANEFYDKSKIQKSKKITASFVKNLDINLNRLSKKVVSVLLDYNKKNSSSVAFFDAFAEYELYIRRGLLKLADKQVIKIESILAKSKLYYLKPFLHHKQTHYSRNTTKASKEKVLEVANNLEESAELLYAISKSEVISLKLEYLIQKNGGFIFKDKQDLEWLEELLVLGHNALPRLVNEFRLYSTVANNIFLINVIKGEIDGIASLTEQFIKNYRNIEESLITDFEKLDILVFIKNMAVVSAHFKINTVFNQCIELTEEEHSKMIEETMKTRVSSNLVFLKSLYFSLNQDEFVSSDDINNMLLLLEKEDKSKIHYFELLLPVACILVRQKEYKKVLDISSIIITDTFNFRTKDVYLSLRMIRAICWFKLENIDMFSFETSSIYRYLQNNNHFGFYILIVNFIKKLSKIKIKNNQLDLLKNLMKEFEVISNKGTVTEKMKAIELYTIIKLAL